MWDDKVRKYWDLGEETVISLTPKKMGLIMRALIMCDGQVHDTHCSEKESGGPTLRYPNRYCAVVLRISLPVGAEEDFEVISEQELSEVRKVGAYA